MSKLMVVGSERCRIPLHKLMLVASPQPKELSVDDAEAFLSLLKSLPWTIPKMTKADRKQNARNNPPATDLAETHRT